MKGKLQNNKQQNNAPIGAPRREGASKQACAYADETVDQYAQNNRVAGNDLKSMAESVTRHALNPDTDKFKYLLSGIDSLDLGLYVIWGSDWKRRLRSMEGKKQRARKKGGLVIGLPSGRFCIFKPSGKGANYRFHLQYEEYNLYIGKAAKPGTSPNVYLSINSKTLWQHGIDKALSLIKKDLKIIGNGSIQLVKVSRVDLCADFLLNEGLSYELLRTCEVTNNSKIKTYQDKNDLETYYVGDVKSPIKLRMYNKGKEVKKEGTKLWFLELWNLETAENVWRVEYQLRRPALKQFGINSLEDLKEKQSGVWHYLTTKWFSLRLPDNEKTERRTIQPFWRAVQECFKQNTNEISVKRNYRQTGTAPVDWYLSHIDGCLSSLAARLGLRKRDDALKELQLLLNKRNNEKDFESACIKKSIELGTLSKRGDR